MKKRKVINKSNYAIFLLFLIMMMSLSFASAKLIVSPGNLSLTKIAGAQANFNFQVSNPDSFTYYNVTFGDTTYASMPLIPVLSSGQIANITAVATSDATGTFALKVKGTQYRNLGSSNITYNINMTFPDPPVLCSFTAIEGDTLRWNNKAADAIKIKNLVTGADIVASLPAGASYVLNAVPQTLSYGLLRAGFQYAACTITILPQTGYSNDPNLNGDLSLNLINVYSPTSLNISSMQNNYIMNFSDIQEGVLTLTNTGDKIAYGINLLGEWFSFSSNGFNLAPGETKPIIYTLMPVILSTTDTNKNYTKQVTITGNFPTITQTYNIFVPYENINMDNATSDFWNQRAAFCKVYPTSVYCLTAPVIEYKFVSNASDVSFNVTMSQQQVRDLWIYNIGLNDKVETAVNYVKETVGNTDERINATDEKVSQLLFLQQENKNSIENMVTNVLVYGSIIFIIVAVVFVCALIYIARQKEKLKKINDWSMQ